MQDNDDEMLIGNNAITMSQTPLCSCAKQIAFYHNDVEWFEINHDGRDVLEGPGRAVDWIDGQTNSSPLLLIVSPLSSPSGRA